MKHLETLRRVQRIQSSHHYHVENMLQWVWGHQRAESKAQRQSAAVQAMECQLHALACWDEYMEALRDLQRVDPEAYRAFNQLGCTMTKNYGTAGTP